MNRLTDTFFILLIATGCLLKPLAATAQTATSDETVSLRPAVSSKSLYHKGQWEFSLESAYLFEVIPNPFFLAAGEYTKNQLEYHLATQILSGRYQLIDPVGPSLLRGSCAVSGSLVYSTIIEGPESYFVGLTVGLAYYFVQPGAKIVPYLEVRGGPGFTDARRFDYAQQQDFTFTYLLGAGLRYDFSPRASFSVGVLDGHLSNAYLTEPNYGFDALGINLGLTVRY